LPITYENGTDYPTTTTSLFAGFDNVYIKRNISNNYGVTLESGIELHLVNNGTGQIYPIPQTLRTDISTGNSSMILEYVLPKNIDTGVYYVRAFADIYYYGLFAVRKIVSTETFNVTSIEDTMTINSITIKDYWGNAVNTSAALLSDSSMPTSNWTNPYTILTEGFGYQICGNITNSYSGDIYWHMGNLVIHNPTTGWSEEEFNSGEERWQRVLKSGDNDICWYSNIPLTIPTHSDYQFDFSVYIGDESEPFVCGDKCEFSGETNYAYIGAIEDSIVFDKWLTKPNATSVGIPGVYIVTEREEYLSHNDDCTYTDQETTDWGNSSYTCEQKDTGVDQLTNLSVYPRAGEKFKVCYQAHNYFSEEVDLEFYDIYIDSDAGETVIQYDHENDGYVPSIQEDSLYLSETPSRAFELGGGLVDSYGSMCSNWMDLPLNLQGGNNWDIQGKVRINPDIYNLEEDVVWNWESDEFLIFGSEDDKAYPDFVTINSIAFTKDNVTEGEYMQLEMNITNNHATKSFESIFHVDFDSNIGGTLRVIKPIPFNDANWNEQSSVFEFAESLEADSTQIFTTPRFKVPNGLTDIDTYDVIDANFGMHILEGVEENVLYSIFWEGTAPTIDIIAPNFEITNISTVTTGVACGPVVHTVTYDNILSDTSGDFEEERYIVKGCIEDTTNDYYIDCVDFEIQPDSGSDQTINFATTLPYTPANVSSGIDVWIYELDENNLDAECLHCGELVDRSSGDDWSDAFTINTTTNESCKYTKRTITWEDDEMYNNYLSRVASESSSTSSGRSADALEGIENKTGTFHLDVACPSTGTIGSDMNCTINAYVEDSQTVQKEVDFTCYISDGITEYSSVNFNQMITKTPVAINQTFAVPSSFAEGTSYVLQCTADYYNLGSRRDSFYDTFTTSGTLAGSVEGGSDDGGATGGSGGALITGGAVDEGESGFNPPDIDDFNPLSPERNWAFMFVEIIILMGVISLICFFIKKKRKRVPHCSYHCKTNWGRVIRKGIAGIIALAIIVLLGTGIWYGGVLVKNSFSKNSPVKQAVISEVGETSQILLQGNLIKSIFLISISVLVIALIIIIFTVILVLIVFKLLNIRGELKFGNDHLTRRYRENRRNSKLQEKLHRRILKDEIKKTKQKR